MPDHDPPFDLDRIRSSTAIGELRYHAAIDSTNNAALAAVRDGDFRDPLLILAQTQTGGRGRGSNRWWSADGSLTFSLVWRPPAHFARAEWPKVALTVGIAVCRTATAFVPQCQFGLRWPNDVYIGERKLAGILVEAPANIAGPDALVIGIGLNVNNALAQAPDDVRARAVSLCDLAGAPLELTDVLLRLLAELRTVLDDVSNNAAPLVEQWKSLCLLTGRRVTIEQGTNESVGTCRGIDRDGALLIETDRGVQRFFAGVLTKVE